jgi:hypothetical protein
MQTKMAIEPAKKRTSGEEAGGAAFRSKTYGKAARKKRISALS